MEAARNPCYNYKPCWTLLATWCCCMSDAFTPTARINALQSPTPKTILHEQLPCTAKRRQFLQHVTTCLVLPPIASASNLPSSTGSDFSKTGSIDAVTPIVAIQYTVLSAKSRLVKSVVSSEICSSLLQSILKRVPREEKAFKRIFDDYSTPVSYKQKFLDQNAFLVYYTKGFDGPGRPKIEEGDMNTLQTQQYGSRNDAWTAIDELFVELEFGERSKGSDDALSSKEELVALFDKVLIALDSYLGLIPTDDVEKVSRQVGDEIKH